MRLLTETTLNRVISGHDKEGYAMISSYRHDYSESENEERNYELKYILKKLGYSYVPVFGGYKERGTDNARVEKSLIVFPYNNEEDSYEDFKVFEQDMINLGDEFEQDSVLIKSPNGNAKYFDIEKGSYMPFEFTGTSINDVQKEYFTALKRWSDTNNADKEYEGSPQRFTYVESYLEDNPMSIMSAHPRHIMGELLDMSDIKSR